jgi:metal-sulfur cluster biosynthetic enzyme
MIISKEEEVLESLRSVIDPEIGLNIVELGLVRNIDIEDGGKVRLTMILTTPFCPYGPQIIAQVKSVLQSATGQPGIVEMGTEMWDPSMMEEGAGGDWGLF